MTRILFGVNSGVANSGRVESSRAKFGSTQITQDFFPHNVDEFFLKLILDWVRVSLYDPNLIWVGFRLTQIFFELDAD